MPDQRGPRRGPFDVDPTVPHPARLYNFLMGGEEHFEADREAARWMYETLPRGVDSARELVRASATFVGRVVRHLAGEVGVRQFLPIGTLIPGTAGVHEVVEGLVPDPRVVYVVQDTTVLAHAHRLLRGARDGSTAYFPGDLSDPPGLVRQAGETFDLREPVAVILQGTLSYVRDKWNPQRMVRQLMEPLASGSYVAITHIASDLRVEEMAEAARRQRELNKKMPLRFVPRSHSRVMQLFEGLELVGPGLVELDLWRPHGVADTREHPDMIPAYGGLARKP